MDDIEEEPPYRSAGVLKKIEKSIFSEESEKEEADIEESELENMAEERLSRLVLEEKKKREAAFKKMMEALDRAAGDLPVLLLLGSTIFMVLSHQSSMLMGRSRTLLHTSHLIRYVWVLVLWIGTSVLYFSLIYYLMRKTYSSAGFFAEKKDIRYFLCRLVISGAALYAGGRVSSFLYRRSFFLSFYLLILPLYAGSFIVSSIVILRTGEAFCQWIERRKPRYGILSFNPLPPQRDTQFFLACAAFGLLLLFFSASMCLFIADAIKVGPLPASK